MAAILSVTYTPNYGGCHRICFRTSETSYCCYQDDTPTEIGVEKTTDIDLTDYQECLVSYPIEIGCGAGINLNGYVQPCCTDASSVSNRVTFGPILYSETACASYDVICENVLGCGQFTRTNCDGAADLTEYEISPEFGTVTICGLPQNTAGSTYTIDTPSSVSCCDCNTYDIYTSLDIDLYYTDCSIQTVQIVLVPQGETPTQICAVPGSIFPVITADAEYITLIDNLGPCIL